MDFNATNEVLVRLGYLGHNKFSLLAVLKDRSSQGDIQATKDLIVYQAYLKYDDEQFRLAERRGMPLGSSFERYTG
jgi:hypothetical protein